MTVSLYLRQTGPGEIVMDMPPRLSGLLDRGPVGQAYQDTLGALGLTCVVDTDGWHSRATIRGNLAFDPVRLQRLREETGDIAAMATPDDVLEQLELHSALDMALDQLGQSPEQEQGPELGTTPDRRAPPTPAAVVFNLTYPFAKQLVRRVWGHTDHCVAPWRASEEQRTLRDRIEMLSGGIACIPYAPDLHPEQAKTLLDKLPDPRQWLGRSIVSGELPTEVLRTLMLLQQSGYPIRGIRGGVE